ncbi:MAG: DUF2235 domain-containing protein [Chloroflexi bacterium]|nr:DUF2235 domain-containing protein [Chloroflexota bacterium]
MARRIVICCDGTWNRPDQKNPTNVVRLARSVTPVAADGESQIVFYDQGVGTGPWLDRLTGGAFGSGLVKNVEDAYRFLVHNYEDGDKVFFFGFSRGAFTARSTVGLIRNVGLLKKSRADQFPKAFDIYRSDEGPDSIEAQDFRKAYSRVINIQFVGVWDTVGALGIPLGGLRRLTRRKHGFHDVELSSLVRNGFHAVAIDEKRGSFRPSLWKAKEKPGQMVEQVWFAGVHSDVGGGYSHRGLSDLAFAWMKAKAESCGLEFDEKYLSDTIRPDHNAETHNSQKGIFRFTGGHTRSIGEASELTEAIHKAAKARYEDPEGAYKPNNLSAYLHKSSSRIASPDWVPGVIESGVEAGDS